VMFQAAQVVLGNAGITVGFTTMAPFVDDYRFIIFSNCT
jgi:hypothetical protein